MRIGVKDFLSPSLPPLAADCDWARFAALQGLDPGRMKEVDDNLAELRERGVSCVRKAEKCTVMVGNNCVI